MLSGYGYIVTGFRELKNKNGEDVRLLKLKSPWKRTDPKKEEWTGPWSKNDSSWSPELKTQAGVDSLKENEFFMSVESF